METVGEENTGSHRRKRIKKVKGQQTHSNNVVACRYLFNLGSQLATDPSALGAKQPRIGSIEIERLEQEIDAMNADLPDLPSFVLPGGSRLNAELHAARAVCRRAERRAAALARQENSSDAPLRYLNRLSDALFVWSRWACLQTGVQETLWQPNQP